MWLRSIGVESRICWKQGQSGTQSLDLTAGTEVPRACAISLAQSSCLPKLDDFSEYLGQAENCISQQLVPLFPRQSTLKVLCRRLYLPALVVVARIVDPVGQNLIAATLHT